MSSSSFISKQSDSKIFSLNLNHHDYQAISKTETFSDINRNIYTIKWYTQLYFLGPLILIISLAIGISFYVFYNGWSLSSATFCASATLMGSIFGVPDQPTDLGAAFTIIYYIYGISLVSSILGAVVGSMIIRAPKIAAEVRRKIAITEPEDEDGDGEIGLYDIMSFWRVKFLHTIFWEEYHKNYIITLTAVLWIVIGVMYGMLYEEWTFNHSLYFAINIVSMAALPNPPCIGESPSNCEIGAFRAYFLTLYVLIGVPIFTFAVAQFAGIMVDRAVRDHELKIIHQPLTQDEYSYAANLYGNDEVLSLGEFTVLELLRLQRVSREDLEQIRILFCAIDEAETGIVDQPMLAKNNLICSSPNWPTKFSQDAILDCNKNDAKISVRNRGYSNASSATSSKRRKISRSAVKSLYMPQIRSNRSQSPSSRVLRRSPSLLDIVTKPSVQTELNGLPECESSDKSDTSSKATDESSNDIHSNSSKNSVDRPTSIRRMSMREYNNLVVPLACKTTLLGKDLKDIINDDEEEADDESDIIEGLNKV